MNLNNPDKRLWYSVLERAFIDATIKAKPGKVLPNIVIRDKREAQEWILSDDHMHFNSFIHVCSQLDIAPSRIRGALEKEGLDASST